MIFLTIGTLQPFDRLVKTVDTLVGAGRIEDQVIGQIGYGSYCPQRIQAHQVLDKKEFDEQMGKAAFIISHAGMGSIITAITLRKPMIVMPRLKKYSEHVNDHQLDTALKFEELGIVLVANTADELIEKIAMIPDFKPAPRVSRIDPLISRISGFLDTLSSLREGIR